MSEDQIPDFSTSTLFNVSGKVALVTGGGTGIGRMIATALVQNGARVYIASRKLSTISSTAESLTKLGPGTCTAIGSNLQSRADCKALAQQLVNNGEKKLHLLINNAGMTWGFNMSDQNEKLESAAWDRLFALNVKCIFYLIVETLPLLEAGSNGNIDPARVINVSSVAGLSAIAEDPLSAPGNGTWSYATSKAAVNHLTRVMASSLAKKHITVNAIAPGVFPSRMTNFGIQHAKKELESIQPLGRIGTSEDMAGLALFMCSRASSHITGAIIPIDGGATLASSAIARL